MTRQLQHTAETWQSSHFLLEELRSDDVINKDMRREWCRGLSRSTPAVRGRRKRKKIHRGRERWWVFKDHVPIRNYDIHLRRRNQIIFDLGQWSSCALRHGIQISMEAILACHPARSTEWLDWVTNSCELWLYSHRPHCLYGAQNMNGGLIFTFSHSSHLSDFGHVHFNVRVQNDLADDVQNSLVLLKRTCVCVRERERERGGGGEFVREGKEASGRKRRWRGSEIERKNWVSNWAAARKKGPNTYNLVAHRKLCKSSIISQGKPAAPP